jgi:hypothetical protein
VLWASCHAYHTLDVTLDFHIPVSVVLVPYCSLSDPTCDQTTHQNLTIADPTYQSVKAMKLLSEGKKILHEPFENGISRNTHVRL